MATNEGLMPDTFSDDRYDEEWILVMSDKSERVLSKNQARYLQQMTATGERGIVNFESFTINISFIVQLYRNRRFLKGAYQLPESTNEKPYEPIPPEKWEEIKKRIYTIVKPIA